MTVDFETFCRTLAGISTKFADVVLTGGHELYADLGLDDLELLDLVFELEVRIGRGVAGTEPPVLTTVPEVVKGFGTTVLISSCRSRLLGGVR